MELLNQLTEAERELVHGLGTPVFPDGDYDIDDIRIVMDSLTDRIQPFASYVLNRVHALLEGDGRWRGDAVFDVEHQDLNDLRSYILTRKADGATWTVDLWPKRREPEITQVTINVHKPGRGGVKIASGHISNGGVDALRFRVEPGAVDGVVSLSAFEDLCRFSQAIRGSMPSSLLILEPVEDFRAFLPMMRVIHAGALDADLLLADGGMPGRLCQARQAYVTHIASRAVCGWMWQRLVPLVDGLREAGAEWGKAFMSYNDGDNSCCAVDFPDGSKGYFSDKAATGDDPHSFIARIDADGNDVRRLTVSLLDVDDFEPLGMVLGGGKQADFIYDFASMSASFPGGRDGWTAMSLLFWQFVTDSNSALAEGTLDLDGQHWTASGTAP